MENKKVSRYNNLTFTRDGSKLVITVELDETKVDAQESKSAKTVVIATGRRNITVDGTGYFISCTVCRTLGDNRNVVEL